MERGLGTLDYNDNQSNLCVSWQQVHQSNYSLMSQQATHSPAFVTKLSPEPEVKEEVKKEDDDFPRSLEEALLGE